MAYLSESDLRSFLKRKEILEEANRNLKSSRSDAKVTIFLSHSHSDKDLVKGFISFLAAYGIEIYVDWRDTGMPLITSAETANQIKFQIKENNLFMALLTRNAINSRWVPWEIGIADQLKGYEKTFIVPVEDNYGQFEGVEYLQVYQSISIAQSGSLAYFRPNSVKGYSIDHLLKIHF